MKEEKQLNNNIVVLGCGESILALTEEEIRFINKSKIVIAINKFAAFYDIVGIIPNYIYFHDELDNAFLIYKYILEKCYSNNLTNLTIFTNKRFKHISSRYFSYIYIPYLKIRSYLKWNILKKRTWNADQVYKSQSIKISHKPLNSKFISVKLEEYDKGELWAKNLNEELFNYKGSLSSVLNICSIISPNTPIYLVGNDFNSSRYFFQDKLEKDFPEWKDYTTNITKQYNKHMSFIPTNGKTFIDAIPTIIKHLNETGNQLYCTNPKSLLCTKANVQFKKLPI